MNAHRSFLQFEPVGEPDHIVGVIVAAGPNLGIGGNNPPEPTPFDAAKGAVNDLANEAQHWLDGVGIKTAAEAAMVGKLGTDLRKARKVADEARKAENEPFDAGKAEVQARYNLILKRADMAISAAQDALTPWLNKVREEQEAIAAVKRAEARRLADEAAAAIKAASDTNLAEREAAEAILEDAKRAERAASKAERQTATAGGEAGTRAISLRTYWVTTLVDIDAAIAHFRGIEPEEFAAFVTKLAERHVSGMATETRAVPGFTVASEKRAV